MFEIRILFLLRSQVIVRVHILCLARAGRRLLRALDALCYNLQAIPICQTSEE